MFSQASRDIFDRVANVALPRCGANTALSHASSASSGAIGSTSNTSIAAPAIVPELRAAASSACLTIAPRALLTRIAVRFISPSSREPINPRVSAFSAQLMLTKSDWASSSSIGTYVAPVSASASGRRVRPEYRMRMPKPFPRRATAVPIAPMPMTPRVAPWMSVPSNNAGSYFFHSPERTYRSPLGTWRAIPSMSAHAWSAVVSVKVPGVLQTAMPRLVASATST